MEFNRPKVGKGVALRRVVDTVACEECGYHCRSGSTSALGHRSARDWGTIMNQSVGLSFIVAIVGGFLAAVGQRREFDTYICANVDGSSAPVGRRCRRSRPVPAGPAYAAADPGAYIAVGVHHVTADGAIVANVPIDSAQVSAQTIMLQLFGDTGAAPTRG